MKNSETRVFKNLTYSFMMTAAIDQSTGVYVAYMTDDSIGSIWVYKYMDGRFKKVYTFSVFEEVLEHVLGYAV